MTRRLVRRGFLVVPVLGVVDEDTEVDSELRLKEIFIADGTGGLARFEATWPQYFGEQRDQFNQVEKDAAALKAIADAVPEKPAPRAQRRAAAKGPAKPAASRRARKP
jgi:hypothetical protein